ncbi:succinic semialdehyde dehydrogenase [Nocardioides bruguierae]|uniref:Succinic semialdehyde dehydrogenase n=1 Tax=Nocardioides bruguierae TaxID=2945102 RepID=A0A9X2IF51_9ACTN|nr:succinic semialdehyde dehydrogenase [Nocardioides bruguierae]MCL8025152.1 succinic semialdehyde dehydrogenase [Nocardioides bruguierae]MCM0620034.1 succinic semialdehyde dehydrogenase [Nocardioides bruguierae]
MTAPHGDSHPRPGDPLLDGPHDPEHDPRAAYVLEPSHVARLTSRVVSTTGRTAEVRSPVNDAPLAHVPQSSEADVAEAFARARVAQAAWARTTAQHRAAVLLRFHDLVLERADEIMDLICWESGKARIHAYDEPAHVALTARYYARTGAATLARRRAPGVVPGLTKVEVNRVPKGVVGVISPWNYPFTMAMCDGLPALMAGNAVVAKPDAQTMLTALLGVDLLEEAGAPPGLWQVVAGPGAEVGGAIVERADYVCFTGSTATGRRIAAGCAERLIGCSLELGGKNPLIVLRDADVERAAEGAVRACFSNAGQLCVSTERLFVADQVYDHFVERFVARTQALSLGAGTGWGVDMGSLTSADQLSKVAAHVEDAMARGVTILTGGRHRPDLGPYVFEPTVLEGVTPDMACFAEETFGPVVAIHRFTDEADAIARANQGEEGLNAAVFGRDTAHAREVARQVRCGTVNVNEGFGATFASIAAPMGGMGTSGLGRRQGAEGLLRFTEAQSVATQRVMPIAPAFGLDDRRYAQVMTGALKVMRKLGRA